MSERLSEWPSAYVSRFLIVPDHGAISTKQPDEEKLKKKKNQTEFRHWLCLAYSYTLFTITNEMKVYIP